MTTTESQIETDLIAKLEALKYAYTPDIRDLASLEANFLARYAFALPALAPAVAQPAPTNTP